MLPQELGMTALQLSMIRAQEAQAWQQLRLRVSRALEQAYRECRTIEKEGK